MESGGLPDRLRKMLQLSEDLQLWITLGLLGLLIFSLIRNLGPPDFLFLGTISLLGMAGILTADEAFAGFANPAVVTVGALFVTAAGLRETGVLDSLGHRILGGAKGERGAMMRLALVVIPFSAFLNNTPLVAMFVPVVIDWCRRRRVSPSKVLIPLSFLAILGGTCTLIGTSTNLVVHGLMVKNNLDGLHLFEIGWVGVPYAIIGCLYLFVLGPLMLPERKELLEQLGERRREYLVEMQVQPGCRLIGKTVESAGLRHLPGLFLIEIDRDGSIIGPVDPEDVIEENDRLVFTGIVSGIVELENIPGLVPAADPAYEVAHRQRRGRRLCEAVISPESPLIGRTVREADFRATYGAAVLAVHRGGERVEKKPGDIRLRPGDTLLMQVRAHFMRAHRNDPSFYLVSNVEEYRPVRWDRLWVAVGLYALLVTLMSTQMVDPSVAGTLTAVLMVALGCISSGDARRSVEWQILVTIAAAFGLSTALQKTGAANLLAEFLFGSLAGAGPIVSLAAMYLAGVLMTAVITNNAAAVLLFPICLEVADKNGVAPEPFLIVLMLAASASFITPIGYQTNMMVYGPGGYRFRDFWVIGAPLNLVLWLAAVVLVPTIWPFAKPI